MQQYETMTPSTEGRELLEEKEQLAKKQRFGANVFYVIAILSLVNSAIMMAGMNLSFHIGLGITKLADAVTVVATEDGSAGAASVGAFAFFVGIGAVGLFFLFGVFAKKKHLWAYVVGMICYALDGLILLMADDYRSMGVHALALIALFIGLSARNQLVKLENRRVVRQPVAHQ